MDEPIENLYFNWLVAKVMYVENPTPSLTYWELLRELHNTEFVWILSGDDNRAEDGLDLRSEFLMEANLPYHPELMTLGCSVFEMMIGLSRHASFDTDIPYHIWFWKFMENLGFQKYNDASKYRSSHIQGVLYDFVWRQYAPDGKGGLFPLRDPHRDQTKVELWYQFCDYINEHDDL